MNQDQNTVSFSREQLAWLEKIFPEKFSSDAAELIRASGQREVIQLIRSKTALKSNIT